MAKKEIDKAGQVCYHNKNQNHRKYNDGISAMAGVFQRVGGRCEPIPNAMRDILPE